MPDPVQPYPPTDDPVPAPRSILVLALAGVGDVLMTTPLLLELRTAFPGATIDVLVMQGQPAREVLDGNLDVNSVTLHDFMREPVWKSLRFCLGLRRRRYDCSITAFPLNRMAYNIVTWLAGARTRIGFDYAIPCGSGGRWLLTRQLREDTGIHVVENNLRILPEVFGRPLASPRHRLVLKVTPRQERFADDFLVSHGLEGRTLVGFHPGSGTTKNLVLKRWAPEKWAELARLVVLDEPAPGSVRNPVQSEQKDAKVTKECGEATPKTALPGSGGSELADTFACVSSPSCSLRPSVQQSLPGSSGATVLLFGGPAEKALKQSIIERAGLPPDRLLSVDGGSVLDVAALVGRMEAFVCGDTLLTHIASAAGTPTVEIMGPTSPESTCPYGVPHRIVRLGLPCSPCYGYSRYGIRCTNPVFMQCLKEITPAQVKTALEELLGPRIMRMGRVEGRQLPTDHTE